MNKRMTSMALAAAMALSMAVPAMAAEGNVNEEGGSSTIPVSVSAKATHFDVTLPTKFPVTVDPDSGDASTSGKTEITNTSAGSIKVSNISVERVGQWKLSDYSIDMSKEAVDCKKIALSVAPKGGDLGADVVGTALLTTDGDETQQTLLNADTATADEWVINGKNVSDETNKLTIKYDAKVAPVSADIENEHIANIIVTVSWNK